MEIVKLYKIAGETPLECLKRYTNEAGWTYLGRLDPLAEGVLLIAKNISPEERASVLALPKEYRFEILYGVSTDTGDVLGIVKETSLKENIPVPDVSKFIGTFSQTYPMYSGRKFLGKPLFSWARKGLVLENMPKKEITIYSLTHNERKIISSNDIFKEIHKKIIAVSGDFRQEEILKKWNEIFLTKKNSFVVDTFTVSASSGIFVRNLAERMGCSLSVPSLAFSILRTKVGDYQIE